MYASQSPTSVGDDVDDRAEHAEIATVAATADARTKAARTARGEANSERRISMKVVD
jgi:hypothetical protein